MELAIAVMRKYDRTYFIFRYQEELMIELLEGRVMKTFIAVMEEKASAARQSGWDMFNRQ